MKLSNFKIPFFLQSKSTFLKFLSMVMLPVKHMMAMMVKRVCKCMSSGMWKARHMRSWNINTKKQQRTEYFKETIYQPTVQETPINIMALAVETLYKKNYKIPFFYNFSTFNTLSRLYKTT